MTGEQKKELRKILLEKDSWTLRKVRILIEKRFEVEYSEMHV